MGGTYKLSASDADAQEMYKSMLDAWFPSNETMPKAFLCDTSEEALLLPDWLKLRMIRSSEPRLVTAGVCVFTVVDVVVFISLILSTNFFSFETVDQKQQLKSSLFSFTSFILSAKFFFFETVK